MPAALFGLQWRNAARCNDSQMRHLANGKCLMVMLQGTSWNALNLLCHVRRAYNNDRCRTASEL